MSIQEFISEYTQAVSDGYAAVFAGAGLSRSSGYINWKELVRPLADKIGLSVDKEHDLIAIAQYYCNESGGRHEINQKILNEFTRDTVHNENIEILTNLPISTYWTTNYDELLEDGLKKNNRKADIKSTQESLAINIYNRDAVVYKMHGDVRTPNEAVIIKDDYETYGNSRSLFMTVLQSDLISKTFLFIGFSFEDPNLDYVLSQIRILLNDSTRNHYCFFEKVKKAKGDKKKDFVYNCAKQELRIKDLRRYGIQAVVLDSYSEITDILRKIKCNVFLKNIFISGSISSYDATWSENKVNTFAFSLAQKLIQVDCHVISGYGLGIGSSIINGALKEIFENKHKHIGEYLCLRPFPQIYVDEVAKEQLWQNYREDMIGSAGITIFMFGNKIENGKVVIASGMIKEFEIAKKMNKIIIPIGSTGGAAKEISDYISNNIKEFQYLEKHIEKLNSIADIEELTTLVIKIIKEQQLPFRQVDIEKRFSFK